VLDPLADMIDLILIMTVNPGFGGQKFLGSQMSKVRAARERIASWGRDVMLEVDGGIDEATAREARNAGADVLVAGTAVFRRKDPGSNEPPDYARNIARLRG
jgi:ribulose-phosphate 3-epimerase